MQDNTVDWARPGRLLCDELPFLPSLCYANLRAPAQFPQITASTYATLCDYPVLSLQDKGARQCLMLALSVLQTAPRQGFTMLVPRASVIKPSYRRLLEHMRVRVEPFTPLELAGAALEAHRDQQNWIPSYQKLHLWALRSAQRVLYIDNDSLVLRNLDHLFLDPDGIGCDCLEHDGKAEDWRMGYGIGGLLLATPGQQAFEQLTSALHAGFDNGTQAWKYPGGDQTLIAQVLGPRLMAANLQIFPDVCFHSAEPLLSFPLNDMYIVHYTWGFKGFDLQIKLPSEQEDPVAQECLNHFALLYKYYYHELDALAAHQPSVLRMKAVLKSSDVT